MVSRPKALSRSSEPDRARRYRVFGLAVAVLLLVGVATYLLMAKAARPGALGILVAELEEPQGTQVSTLFTRNLRQALRSYRDVKVVGLGRAITEEQGGATARAEGTKRKAALVVWGSYDPDQASLSLHFEIVKLPPGVPEPTLTQSLAVQMKSSTEMVIPKSFAMGLAHYVAEDWDGAVAAFGHILVQSMEQPTDSVLGLAFVLTGDAYYAKGELAQAVTSYDQAISVQTSFDSPHSDRESKLVCMPGAAEVFVKRGVAYGAQGDYDRALKDFDKAIALNRNLAEAYYNSGNAYYAQRELELAIASYDQAVAKRPDYAEAYCNRGLTYASDGDYERAIQDLDQAIQLKPDFVRAYSNRGSVRYAQGNYSQAVADYDQVIALEPDFAEAYFNRGATYMAQGEKEKAVKDLEKFLELSSDPSWRQVAQQKLEELGAQ